MHFRFIFCFVFNFYFRVGSCEGGRGEGWSQKKKKARKCNACIHHVIRQVKHWTVCLAYDINSEKKKNRNYHRSPMQSEKSQPEGNVYDSLIRASFGVPFDGA